MLLRSLLSLQQKMPHGLLRRKKSCGSFTKPRLQQQRRMASKLTPQLHRYMTGATLPNTIHRLILPVHPAAKYRQTANQTLAPLQSFTPTQCQRGTTLLPNNSSPTPKLQRLRKRHTRPQFPNISQQNRRKRHSDDMNKLSRPSIVYRTVATLAMRVTPRPRRTRSPTILCIHKIVEGPHRPLHPQTICLRLLRPLHLLFQLHSSPKRKDYAEHTSYRTLPLLRARITLLHHSLMNCLTVTRCISKTRGSPRRRYCDESSRLRILIPFQDQRSPLPLNPLQGACP